MGNILYIINPAGRGGTSNKAWDRFQALWPDTIAAEDMIVTERRGDARRIAAAAEGYDILVAVGGDGTVGEVMSAIMEREGAKPKLGIIPAGTGNDAARNAGVCSVEDAVAALQGGSWRAFDVMRADYLAEGKPKHSYAFLMACIGFSANSLMRPWMKRLLGATGAYYLACFLQIIIYRPSVLTVNADGSERCKGTRWMVLIGNSEYSSGGSMCIAPGARCDDGELNVTVFPVKSKFRMITLLPKVATGEHIKEPGVDYFPAKKIEIDSDRPVVVDLDGDILGTTPVTFTVCPNAMDIITP